MKSLATAVVVAWTVSPLAWAAPGDTELVSVHFGPSDPEQWVYPAGISADGRWVIFNSNGDGLTPGDANGQPDCIVRDRTSGRTFVGSVSTTDQQGQASSLCAELSEDGRHLLFMSFASNLVGNDSNGSIDLFHRDLVTGLTERVSVGNGGAQLPAGGFNGSMSADARFVAFRAADGVMVRDRLNQQTRFLDLPNLSSGPLLSADGRYLAFGQWGRAVLMDLQSGHRERVDVDSGETPAVVNRSYVNGVSRGGRYVLFTSSANGLTPGDFDHETDVFLRDRALGVTERVTQKADGSPFEWNFTVANPALSSDGRFVTFNMFDGRAVDHEAILEVYLRDRARRTLERVNRNSAGVLANRTSWGAVVSADGRFVGFGSRATNLSAADPTSELDAYVRERSVVSTGSFTLQPSSLGFGGVNVGSTIAARRVTVTNTGTVDLTIKWIGIAGPDASQFARRRQCPLVLEVGASCTVDVWFAPTTTGARAARLVVATADGTRHSTSLSGTGT
jgi:Tol biopolymer transport system component